MPDTNLTLADIEALFRRLFAELVGPGTTPPPPEDPEIGELNEYGAHQLRGQPRDMWFFTLSGWDKATTLMQKANLRAQLGLDEGGRLVSTGPAPVGFEEGQVANRFNVPLYTSDGTDMFGGIKWVRDDGPLAGGNGQYKFKRIRVRARGYKAILESLK